MKKTFISVLLIFMLLPFTNYSSTQQITDYEGLFDALMKGEEVRIVIHYGRTRLITDNEEFDAPDVIGGMHISAFEYFSKGSIRNPRAMIVTSETVLIGHPRYEHVYNYARIRFYDDNEVQITAKYLTTGDYETVMDQKFYGSINNGKNDGAVYLFKSK